MKRKITIHPQAWVNDNAVDVDAQGETTFYVNADHLKQYDADTLKYELEPYQNLPQTPKWIREWQGPFWFEIEDEPELVQLEQAGEGAYTYEEWSIQNPHLMNSADPDEQWYATSDNGGILGPFDTLDEVRQYLARLDTIDDWRGDLAMTIRELGREDIADEIGGISDEEAMTYRDSDEDPKVIAQRIIAAAPALESRRYSVTIADTYTHYRTIEVDATSEEEARAKAERQYEETYDASSVFEAFAMSGAEGEHSAVGVNELEPA